MPNPVSAEPFDFVPDGCPECAHYYMENPGLVHAFASVGIEHGKSTWDMARDYFAEFHKKKHKEQR